MSARRVGSETPRTANSLRLVRNLRQSATFGADYAQRVADKTKQSATFGADNAQRVADKTNSLPCWCRTDDPMFLPPER